MKPDTPLWQWSATDLHRAYREGRTTPLAALQACLDRITEVNPKINALVRQRDAVWQEAQDSTERFRTGQPWSALDGLPLSIKDNLCTVDMPTTWGCPALRNYQSGTDEWPVARARAAGALIVGKTNVPEFTLEGYTDNPLFGTTRNPWNLALTPGGSSGGAVASVAAGCTPLALGTDGGGSIRRPASHCGLVGFKPSIGSVARGNGLPSLLLDFEVVGPMARSVADARLLFEVLRGPVDGDRASLAAAAAASRAASQPLTQALRVLYVSTLNQAPVDPEIAAHCAVAAEQMTLLGHTVHTDELPLNLDDINSAWSSVGQIGLAALFAQHPGWRQGVSAKYLAMADLGSAVSAPVLWTLLDRVERLRDDCTRLFKQWDVIAMPSAAALPWLATQAFPTEIAGQPVGPRGHAVFTGWVNAAGLPAISIPVAPSARGLPIGLQLIGPYGADDALFDLAQSIEVQNPWAHRWPAL
jgi:aspartyl-tRNA(Asn)/glutamyl-tRNA(Gln) amidotransferase subunit A